MLAEHTSSASPDPVVTDRPDSRFARMAPMLVFAAAIAVLLGPSLVGARVVLPHDLLLERLPLEVGQSAPAAPVNVELRDTLDTYYPVQHELLSRIKSGRDASWLDNVSLGLPGSSFIGWGALSPFNLPALVMPFSLAWSWAMALRLFAAMAGAYLLARSVGSGRAGGTVAGLAFGLSGFMVGWLGWPQSHVAAFVPWLIWSARLVAGGSYDPVTEQRGPAPWWAFAALALSTAGLWLGGFPAVAAYALVAAGIVAAHAAWTQRADGARPALGGLLRAAAAVLVGTGVVAFLLVPSVHTLAQLSTGYRGAAWTTALPVKAALTFLIPGFFGDVQDRHFWLGLSYVEGVAYAGVLTVLLCVPAWLIVPRRRGIGLFTGLGLGTAAIVYGVPVAQQVLGQIPMLRDNVPTRSIVLLVLALAVVAGLGMDALLRYLRGDAHLDRRVAIALIAVSGLAGVVFLSAGPYRRAWTFVTSMVRQDFATELARTASAATLRAAAIVTAAAFVVIVAKRFARSQLHVATSVLIVGLIALSAVDLLSFAGGRNVQVSRASIFPDAPGFDALVNTSQRYRVAGSDAVGLPNTHLEYGFKDVRAHAFVTTRQAEVLARMGAQFISPTVWDLTQVDSGRWQPWLSLLGVRTVVSPEISNLEHSYLVQSQHNAVLESLIAGQAQQLETAAPQPGNLSGIKVLVGTFMRENAGVVKLTLRTPRGTSRVQRDAASLQDVRWATFPLPNIAVQPGEPITITIEGSTRDPETAVALLGRAPTHDAVGAPALALVYDSPPVRHQKVGQVYLVDNPNARPVIDVFTAVEVVADKNAAILAIEEGGGEALAKRVVLEGAPKTLPGGGHADVVALIRDGGSVRAMVDAPRGAILVVREQPLHDWSATVDGKDTPVLNADVLFMAVAVPPGRHEVELRFRPRGQPLGVQLTVVSLVALLAWTLWVRRRSGVMLVSGDTHAASEQEPETPQRIGDAE